MNCYVKGGIWLYLEYKPVSSGNTISGPVVFSSLFSSLLCMRMCTFAVPHVGEGLPFFTACQVAHKHSCIITLPASEIFQTFHPKNLFRGLCYVTDLKSLSRGDSPPTTSISWASYSAMPTEAWSERGHRLHLLLPVVCAHERPSGPERSTAGCSQSRTEWVVSDREGVRKREKGGWEMWRSLCVFTRHFLSQCSALPRAEWHIWWHLVKCENAQRVKTLESPIYSFFKHQLRSFTWR